MSSVIYGSGLLKKEFTCVEIASLYSQTGAYIPSGPSSVQGIFTNTLAETINATISVAAGGAIAPAGLSFTLSGASATYLVTVTFNRKFSGSILFSATSLDNSLAGGVDKICGANIGNPDVIPTDGEVVGNCFQAVLGSNPGTPKVFGWSEVNELTSFTFQFQRTNPGSTVTFGLSLTEKSLAKWEKNNSVTPPTYTDPLTTTLYTTLPAGVFEVNCEENNEAVSYSKELCYKVGSQISFDYSANPAEPWDAYNGARPRTDGVPFLPYAIGGFNFNEFDPTGRYLYSVSGASFTTHTYVNFALASTITLPINFTGFPAAVAMTPVGLAVHPTTGIIYLTYIDGSRRVWLATLTATSQLQLVGDTQFNSAVTAPIDAHDITFTSSGQLVMAHGSNLYLIDHTTGLLNSGVPVAITGATTNAFAIRNISRYANGDLHMSGQDSGIGPIVIIYDGESYTKVRHWASNNSTTPPDSRISTAYPINPEVRFLRLFIKNIETNSVNVDDRDLVTGMPITIPQNAVVKDCSSTASKVTSWSADLCYVIDKNIISQGVVEIAGGQIVSNAACTAVGGFVPPVAVTYSSMTHNNTGNVLYALNPGGPTLDSYNWTTISTPGGLVSTPLTGLTIGSAAKSLRTRWSDGSMWLMTEQVVGANRNYEFWIVNTATGACTRQGVVTYPAGGFNNGHFAWGVDDDIYFSYNLGAGIYRVSTLSKISYNIQNFVADVNYVIDNINTDLPNQRLILSKRGVAGLDFLSYGGQIVSTCGGAIYADAMHAPFGTFQVGDTIQRFTRVYINDLITGDVTSYNRSYITGEDIVLPSLARLVACDNSIVPVAPSIPRFQLFTGIVSFNKLLRAPNAKSITVTRIAGNITITDSQTGPHAINAAFTTTWTADRLGGQLIIAGTAAGSIFSITWI